MHAEERSMRRAVRCLRGAAAGSHAVTPCVGFFGVRMTVARALSGFAGTGAFDACALDLQPLALTLPPTQNKEENKQAF